MKSFPVESVFFQGENLRVDSRAPGVKHLVLTRPQTRNAFHAGMIAELNEALTRLAAIPDESAYRLLILEGDGPVFCAGADLAYMKEQAARGEVESLQDARVLGSLFFRLASQPVPVIAAVRGAAIGGGLGLAACADSVLAAHDAVFATSEVRLGIVAGVISPYIVRKCGVGHASPFLLTGSRLNADEAQGRALVSRVVTRSEDFAHVLDETVHSFLAAGPNAARRTKALIKKIAPLPGHELFEFSAQAIAFARCSSEGQAGLSAFFNKTQAPWVPPASSAVAGGPGAGSRDSSGRIP